MDSSLATKAALSDPLIEAKHAKKDKRHRESAINRAINRGLAIKREDVRKYKSKDYPDATLCVKSYDYTHILRLTPQGEALIADYYGRRYGLEITIIAETIFLNDAIKKAIWEHQGDFKAGFLVPALGRCDDIPHATPLLLGREGHETYAISMDSSETSAACLRASNLVDKFYRADGARQSDHYSCRTEALVLLKDALRRPHPLADFKQTGERKLLLQKLQNVRFLKLPPYLLKAVQNPNFSPAWMQACLNEPVNEAKGKTLAQHREQHTHNLRLEIRVGTTPLFEEEKRWNTYLSEKGHEFVALADWLYDEAQGRGGLAEVEAIYRRRIFGGIREV
jgi:hypothetical protein